MKIQYSDWQQIDLSKFENIYTEFGDKLKASSNALSDSNVTVLSRSNTKITGFSSGYTVSITGSHLDDNQAIAQINTFSVNNSVETIKMQTSVNYNKYTHFFAGYASQLTYDNISGDSFLFNGKFNMDSNADFTEGKIKTFTATINGYTATLTGELTIDANSDISGGIIHSFSFKDNQGHRFSIDGISEDYNHLNGLTSNVTSLAGLYNALDFSGKDTVTGSSGDDTLDGKAGVDTLIGGQGNDTYIVDLLANGKLQDKITEAKNAGIDTLELRGDISLAKATTIKLVSNVENIDISLTHHSLLNLTGDKANNALTGNAANNVIDGGAGVDAMQGGAGDDTYVIDNIADTVTEAQDAGIDTVLIKIKSAGNYTLGDNIENASLLNTKAFDLTGNALNNVLIGNAAANTLEGGLGSDALNGGKGSDILNGGKGDDFLTGGLGADIFRFLTADKGTSGNPSIDTMTDFKLKEKDVIDLKDLQFPVAKSDTQHLLNYIDISINGNNTELHLSLTGGFSQGLYDANQEDMRIVFSNVDLLAGVSESALLESLLVKNQLLIE